VGHAKEGELTSDGVALLKAMADDGYEQVVHCYDRATGLRAIIAIHSTGTTQAAIYVGTKGAVDSITKSLAKEFAPRRIRVNGVRPGFVITEGTHAAGMAGGEFEAYAVANTPLGRAGQPAELAGAYVLLASDEGSYITGAVIAAA